VDPQKVAAELKSGGAWSSILGPVSFDKKGDVQGPGYVFYKWSGGNYSEL
jgi:branched-chain amino acid transport system substrate-binding protein